MIAILTITRDEREKGDDYDRPPLSPDNPASPDLKHIHHTRYQFSERGNSQISYQR